MIKSYYDNQENLIKSLSELYIGAGFHMDPTYSKGIIHRGIVDPEFKSDISPAGDYLKSDCRQLPYLDNSIRSIMFDPPFLAGGGKTGKMNKRFGSYQTVQSLLCFYEESLHELYRVLKRNGFLVFKCQDLCNGRTQTFSHCEIYNMAIKQGFYARDLFILITKNRMKPHNFVNQQNARKHHNYFWVFQKCKKKNKTWTKT